MFLGISLGHWITIGVAMIALGGVLLAQWNARVVLQRQLDHDSEQRDRERKMSLRREVYLEAAAGRGAPQVSPRRSRNVIQC
jgi:hypothetical protein